MAHRDPPDLDAVEGSCIICGSLTDNFIQGQPICVDCWDAKLEAEGQPEAEEDEESEEEEDEGPQDLVEDLEEADFYVQPEEDEDDGHRKADS